MIAGFSASNHPQQTSKRGAIDATAAVCHAAGNMGGGVSACVAGREGPDRGARSIEGLASGGCAMTPGSVRRVPNKPKTPMHSFRVEHDLWNAAKAKARAEGTTITDVLRKALQRYVKRR